MGPALGVPVGSIDGVNDGDTEGLVDGSIVGTDDGLIQITTNGGESWRTVDNILGVPNRTYVNAVLASQHNENVIYAAFNHHKYGDFRPYIYKSSDKGATWSKISNGLPQDDYVKVVRQDPINPNLVYAGMEHGIFASWDKGGSWTKINNNLPNVSVRDLRIQARDRDLIVGTHGRGAKNIETHRNHW